MANDKNYATFYNIMEYDVFLRKVWEKGSPPVQLSTGATIEGPYEMLVTFPFLRPVSFDFHLVPSMTQNNNFQFQDIKLEDINKTHDFKIISHSDPHNVADQIDEIYKDKVETVENPSAPPSTAGLPFDLATVNWMKVTMDDLRQAIKVLRIQVPANVESMNPKAQKWEFIRMVKKALGVGK